MDDIDELIEKYSGDQEFDVGRLHMEIRMLEGRIERRDLHIKGLEAAAQKRCEELQYWKGMFENAQAGMEQSAAEEVKLKQENERLISIIKEAGLHEKAPCCLCDYNGEGYFQPGKHKCMEGR